MRHSINPNPYTGVFGNDGARYAEDVAEVIRTCTPGRVAGFIAETIQGVGGTVPLANGYLPAVYQAGLRVGRFGLWRGCRVLGFRGLDLG